MVPPLVEHGAASADVGAADAGVRGGGAAEDDRLHAARLLAEPPQQIRPARHRRWLYMDFYAFHTKGKVTFVIKLWESFFTYLQKRS